MRLESSYEVIRKRPDSLFFPFYSVRDQLLASLRGVCPQTCSNVRNSLGSTPDSFRDPVAFARVLALQRDVQLLLRRNGAGCMRRSHSCKPILEPQMHQIPAAQFLSNDHFPSTSRTVDSRGSAPQPLAILAESYEFE